MIAKCCQFTFSSTFDEPRIKSDRYSSRYCHCSVRLLASHYSHCCKDSVQPPPRVRKLSTTSNVPAFGALKQLLITADYCSNYCKLLINADYSVITANYCDYCKITVTAKLLLLRHYCYCNYCDYCRLLITTLTLIADYYQSFIFVIFLHQIYTYIACISILTYIYLPTIIFNKYIFQITDHNSTTIRLILPDLSTDCFSPSLQ